MKQHAVGAAFSLLLLLAACRGAAPPDGAIATATEPVAVPTAATAASEGAGEPVTALAAVSSTAPLAGPVIGFYFEDSYEDVYFSVFDVGSGAFREFHGGHIGVYEARWFNGGCQVYANGQLYDLNGTLVWTVPDEVSAAAADLHTSQLSPGRNWLSTIVASGETTAQGAASRDVEAVRLAAPFVRVRLTERGGADPTALLWSADDQWLLTSDYDANGILQVYRRYLDGREAEQLTDHNTSAGQINVLALSPDGLRLAYGVRNLVHPRQPYTYSATDEGWIGVVDLATGESLRISLPKLAAAESGRGLVWDASGERLLVVGDSLPLAVDDPLAGRQVHWLTAGGEIERSFYQGDAPGAHLGWISPLDDIDTLLFSSLADVWRFEDGVMRQLTPQETPPLGMDVGRRPVGVLPAVLGFAGEAACGQ